MSAGLFTRYLDRLDPAAMPISYPSTVSRQDATRMLAGSPSNQQVVDACKAAYGAHMNAVDQLTLGSIDTARRMQPEIADLHSYDWNSQAAAPSLARPILESPSMGSARSAVVEDPFYTFFVGIEMDLDVIAGGEGGAGVGFGFPTITSALWMAYGGLRFTSNVDWAVNLNVGIFVEEPSKVAGDYLGIEVSAEPVYEGPSVGFGIHLTPDLEKLRGFSVSVGVELGILPLTAALVYGSITTMGGDVLRAPQAELASTER